MEATFGTEFMSRYIGLIDVYTFATQVMAKEIGDTNWDDFPTVSVLTSGRIISANDKAKQLEIDNTVKLEEALAICKNLKQFVQPNLPNNKPDQTLFRRARHDVFKVIETCTAQWEYPPILYWVPQDETYIDMTDQVNYMFDNDIPVNGNLEHAYYLCSMRLVEASALKWPLHTNRESPVQNYKPQNEYEAKIQIASKLCSNLQERVHSATKFHCSAGIGPNKMLAKIACGLNPPGSLSVLSKAGINKWINSWLLPLKKLSPLDPYVKGQLIQCGISTMGELQRVPFAWLRRNFGHEQAEYIMAVARGYDPTRVTDRRYIKNVNCAKNFRRNNVRNFDALQFHVYWLTEETLERLKEQLEWYGRKPTHVQLTINFWRKTITIPVFPMLLERQTYIAILMWKRIFLDETPYENLMTAEGHFRLSVMGAKISCIFDPRHFK